MSGSRTLGQFVKLRFKLIPFASISFSFSVFVVLVMVVVCMPCFAFHP